MSQRIPKLNELIKEEVGKLILKEFDFPKDILVTVTRAIITPDLREGRVFVSVLPEEKKDLVLDVLNRKIYFLQKKIDKKLKMKFVPKISFVEEKKTIEAAKIEEILEKLKKNKK